MFSVSVVTLLRYSRSQHLYGNYHSEGMEKVLFSQVSVHILGDGGTPVWQIGGGGYPHPRSGQGVGTPSQVRMGGTLGYPPSRSGPRSEWGYPHLGSGQGSTQGIPHLRIGGYPIQPNGGTPISGWGTPSSLTGGVPPFQDRRVPHPTQWGVPHLRTRYPIQPDTGVPSSQDRGCPCQAGCPLPPRPVPEAE